MKILIVDKFESVGVEKLRQLADEVACEPGLKGDALTGRITEYDPDVLIVRSAKIPAAAIQAGRRLNLVVRAGAGVDNIDVEAASLRGVVVANCPGQNAAAVAELTLGLIVSLDRRIPDNVIDLRAHKWNKKEYSKAMGLKGRTLGVVGAGGIGSEVARRALAFDMKVLYFHLGRTRRLADFPGCRRADLDELLRESDIVTIHVSGGDSTKRLIDEKRIGLMKSHALLINTSRGSVIDEGALVRALKEKRIRAAALDVFENEPPADGTTFASPLCDLPNLYGTHHIGASTDEAQLAVADETVRIVAEYKLSGRVLNAVNLRQKAPTHLLVVRFVNKPGGLAHVFSQLAQDNINVEEMDHVIYDGGLAACAHIRLDKEPSEGALQRIRTGHANVMGAEIMRIE